MITSYAYDNRGDRTGVADPVDNARLSVPANLAQVEQNASPGPNAASPTGSSWRTATAYDAAGDPVQQVTNPGAGDGRRYTTRRQYDAAGSLLAVQDARGTSPPALGSEGLGGFALSDGQGAASADHAAT